MGARVGIRLELDKSGLCMGLGLGLYMAVGHGAWTRIGMRICDYMIHHYRLFGDRKNTVLWFLQ